jgi:advillin
MCGGVLGSDMSRNYIRQCQEPEDFLQFFPEGFYILNGKRTDMKSAMDAVREGTLFSVIAPYGEACRVIQQEVMDSDRLNPHNTYCVVKGDHGFLWRGGNSCEKEHTYAQKLFNELNTANKVDFDEGNEPEEFWEMLGGKHDYQQIKDMMLLHPGFEPMLFEISNCQGYMHMKQLPAFTQYSLNEHDVYILDNFNKMFIWIGKKSNKFEKNGAYKRADKYIAALSDGRNKDSIVIAEVEQGQEPPLFKVLFPNWDDKFFMGRDFDALMKQHSQPAEGQKQASPFDGFDDPANRVMAYADLKGNQKHDGVKYGMREMYLSDAEFEEVFKMKKEAYQKLGQGRKNDLKKRFNLF